MLKRMCPQARDTCVIHVSAQLWWFCAVDSVHSMPLAYAQELCAYLCGACRFPLHAAISQQLSTQVPSPAHACMHACSPRVLFHGLILIVSMAHRVQLPSLYNLNPGITWP